MLHIIKMNRSLILGLLENRMGADFWSWDGALDFTSSESFKPSDAEGGTRMKSESSLPQFEEDEEIFKSDYEDVDYTTSVKSVTKAVKKRAVEVKREVESFYYVNGQAAIKEGNSYYTKRQLEKMVNSSNAQKLLAKFNNLKDSNNVFTKQDVEYIKVEYKKKINALPKGREKTEYLRKLSKVWDIKSKDLREIWIKFGSVRVEISWKTSASEEIDIIEWKNLFHHSNDFKIFMDRLVWLDIESEVIDEYNINTNNNKRTNYREESNIIPTWDDLSPLKATSNIWSQDKFRAEIGLIWKNDEIALKWLKSQGLINKDIKDFKGLSKISDTDMKKLKDWLKDNTTLFAGNNTASYWAYWPEWVPVREMKQYKKLERLLQHMRLKRDKFGNVILKEWNRKVAIAEWLLVPIITKTLAKKYDNKVDLFLSVNWKIPSLNISRLTGTMIDEIMGLNIDGNGVSIGFKSLTKSLSFNIGKFPVNLQAHMWLNGPSIDWTVWLYQYWAHKEKQVYLGISADKTGAGPALWMRVDLGKQYWEYVKQLTSGLGKIKQGLKSNPPSTFDEVFWAWSFKWDKNDVVKNSLQQTYSVYANAISTNKISINRALQLIDERANTFLDPLYNGKIFFTQFQIDYKQYFVKKIVGWWAAIAIGLAEIMMNTKVFEWGYKDVALTSEKAEEQMKNSLEVDIIEASRVWDWLAQFGGTVENWKYRIPKKTTNGDDIFITWGADIQVKDDWDTYLVGGKISTLMMKTNTAKQRRGIIIILWADEWYSKIAKNPDNVTYALWLERTVKLVDKTNLTYSAMKLSESKKSLSKIVHASASLSKDLQTLILKYSKGNKEKITIKNFNNDRTLFGEMISATSAEEYNAVWEKIQNTQNVFQFPKDFIKTAKKELKEKPAKDIKAFIDTLLTVYAVKKKNSHKDIGTFDKKGVMNIKDENVLLRMNKSVPFNREGMKGNDIKWLENLNTWWDARKRVFNGLELAKFWRNFEKERDAYWKELEGWYHREMMNALAFTVMAPKDGKGSIAKKIKGTTSEVSIAVPNDKTAETALKPIKKNDSAYTRVIKGLTNLMIQSLKEWVYHYRWKPDEYIRKDMLNQGHVSFTLKFGLDTDHDDIVIFANLKENMIDSLNLSEAKKEKVIKTVTTIATGKLLTSDSAETNNLEMWLWALISWEITEKVEKVPNPAPIPDLVYFSEDNDRVDIVVRQYLDADGKPVDPNTNPWDIVQIVSITEWDDYNEDRSVIIQNLDSGDVTTVAINQGHDNYELLNVNGSDKVALTNDEIKTITSIAWMEQLSAGIWYDGTWYWGARRVMQWPNGEAIYGIRVANFNVWTIDRSTTAVFGDNRDWLPTYLGKPNEAVNHNGYEFTLDENGEIQYNDWVDRTLCKVIWADGCKWE